jgi:hypothetical protein
MMATVRHVTSTSGLRKFQADGFLFDGVYVYITASTTPEKNLLHTSHSNTTYCIKLSSPYMKEAVFIILHI